MTETRPRPPAASAFDAVAADYEASTVPYPDRAVEWMLPSNAQAALDLGAGTGQLARHLVARGIATVAVDPSDGMRRELAKVLPGVRNLSGSAESIPLPDASFDVVLVGHAWHCADLVTAVPEVARVLRPGGWLGLVWNVRDERVDWVRQLDRIVHRRPKHQVNSENPPVGAPFAPIERLDVEWTYSYAKSDLVDLVAVRLNGMGAAAIQERDAILAELAELLDRHPDLSGRGSIELPYVTRCARTHKR
ncbi:methyltransferase domain-containing protein [Nocardia sp. NPDC048505]|uniref:class I SAM-dependent methyltransferase n=1 Tax=Nocardia sp. NPDC048505 TaxID=3155756 RepID=UPI0033E33169